jgi:hypothetical protein
MCYGCIEIVLQPRNGKTWFLAGSILPYEAQVDAAVRELYEETSTTRTIDNFTLLRGNPVRVPSPARQHQSVYVFSVSAHAPYVTANLRTPAKVEQVVNALSTVHLGGTCVVSIVVDIDGLTLPPSKIWLVKETQRKCDLLHFGYVAHWESFPRGDEISRQLFLH